MKYKTSRSGRATIEGMNNVGATGTKLLAADKHVKTYTTIHERQHLFAYMADVKVVRSYGSCIANEFCTHYYRRNISTVLS